MQDDPPLCAKDGILAKSQDLQPGSRTTTEQITIEIAAARQNRAAPMTIHAVWRRMANISTIRFSIIAPALKSAESKRGDEALILKISIIVLVLVLAVLVFAATKPNTLLVQRSVTIKAPPEKIFALINDFHNWTRWAPQDREDPTMSRTYSGRAEGLGAISEWNSSGSAGRGQMSIVESIVPRRVSITVDWVKPFQSHNVNDFRLEPAEDSTKVTWSMQGTNLFIMKIMGVFVNMDRVVGKHFESGLYNLKTLAEQ